VSVGLYIRLCCSCCLVMSLRLLLSACEMVTVVIASLAVSFRYTTLSAVVHVSSEGDMLIYYNLASIVCDMLTAVSTQI